MIVYALNQYHDGRSIASLAFFECRDAADTIRDTFPKEYRVMLRIDPIQVWETSHVYLAEMKRREAEAQS